jgi:hypothetical protein
MYIINLLGFHLDVGKSTTVNQKEFFEKNLEIKILFKKLNSASL